jgi:hypothetical protein
MVSTATSVQFDYTPSNQTGICPTHGGNIEPSAVKEGCEVLQRRKTPCGKFDAPGTALAKGRVTAPTMLCNGNESNIELVAVNK